MARPRAAVGLFKLIDCDRCMCACLAHHSGTSVCVGGRSSRSRWVRAAGMCRRKTCRAHARAHRPWRRRPRWPRWPRCTPGPATACIAPRPAVGLSAQGRRSASVAARSKHAPAHAHTTAPRTSTPPAGGEDVERGGWCQLRGAVGYGLRARRSVAARAGYWAGCCAHDPPVVRHMRIGA